MPVFRYGIEHECAFLRPDGSFADATNTSFAEFQAIIDDLPEDPDDYTDLRVGDAGIKRKRWYVEGFERFTEDGRLLRCDPKGIEIRTRIHDSIEAAVGALTRDAAALSVVADMHGFTPTTIAFNPVRSRYIVAPPLNGWELRHRTGSPEERTAHLHMSTFGPDLNLSCADLRPEQLVDVARKLTYYSPWLVPLSFSSPFCDGRRWNGLSARTHQRTGARPAVMVFLEPGLPQEPTDPSLTQMARLAAENGRVEFKAFDACPDPALYGELLTLLTGVVLDTSLRQRRTVPDAKLHRRVARLGLGAPDIHAGTGALLDAAERALVGRDADLARIAALWQRWAQRECPATAMLTRFEAGEPVAGLLPPTPSHCTRTP